MSVGAPHRGASRIGLHTDLAMSWQGPSVWSDALNEVRPNEVNTQIG